MPPLFHLVAHGDSKNEYSPHASSTMPRDRQANVEYILIDFLPENSTPQAGVADAIAA